MERGIEPKIAFIKRNWKGNPLGFTVWMALFTFVGAVFLGGLLVSLLHWGLGSPDPFSEPIFDVPGSGPYDSFIWILSGLLFTWTIGIPFYDWVDRQDGPADPLPDSVEL